jgi:peptide/nickel transport system permease protein
MWRQMNYYVRRFGQAVFVFFAAVTLTFVMYRLMPFGPIEALRNQFLAQMLEAGQTPTEEQIQRINNLVKIYTGINPDQPLYVAYYDYMSDVILHLDFGKSIYKRDPVFEILFKRMPWSIFISVYGLGLGVTTSLLFGALMAYNEGSKFDTGMTVFTIINTTVPYYVVAILSLIFFAYWFNWFPTGGRMNPNTTPGANLPFIVGLVRHTTLPIFSTFIAGFGGALAFRGNCIREMGKGYLRVARLRGISQGRLAIRYVGRNALLPIYTGLMMGIAGVFGSSVILEKIFNYPAMGFVTFQALKNRDYPLLMGAFIFFTAITLLGILVADLTYGLIDPRVKSGDDREAY